MLSLHFNACTPFVLIEIVRFIVRRVHRINLGVQAIARPEAAQSASRASNDASARSGVELSASERQSWARARGATSNFSNFTPTLLLHSLYYGVVSLSHKPSLCPSAARSLTSISLKASSTCFLLGLLCPLAIFHNVLQWIRIVSG